MILRFPFAAYKLKGGVDLVKTLPQRFKLIGRPPYVKMAREIAVMYRFDKLAYLVLGLFLKTDKLHHFVNYKRHGNHHKIIVTLAFNNQPRRCGKRYKHQQYAQYQ